MDIQETLQKQTLIHLKEKLLQLVKESDGGRTLQPIEVILPLATCIEIIRTYPLDQQKKEKVAFELDMIHQQMVHYQQAPTELNHKLWRVVPNSMYPLDELAELAAKSLKSFLEQM